MSAGGRPPSGPRPVSLFGSGQGPVSFETTNANALKQTQNLLEFRDRAATLNEAQRARTAAEGVMGELQALDPADEAYEEKRNDLFGRNPWALQHKTVLGVLGQKDETYKGIRGERAAAEKRRLDNEEQLGYEQRQESKEERGMRNRRTLDFRNKAAELGRLDEFEESLANGDDPDQAYSRIAGDERATDKRNVRRAERQDRKGRQAKAEDDRLSKGIDHEIDVAESEVRRINDQIANSYGEDKERLQGELLLAQDKLAEANRRKSEYLGIENPDSGTTGADTSGAPGQEGKATASPYKAGDDFLRDMMK